MTKTRILDYESLKLNTTKDNTEDLEKTQTMDFSSYSPKKQRY